MTPLYLQPGPWFGRVWEGRLLLRREVHEDVGGLLQGQYLGVDHLVGKVRHVHRRKSIGN